MESDPPMGKSNSRRRAPLLAATLLVLLCAPLLTAQAEEGAFRKPGLFDAVETVTLENGMLFLLLPRHNVPSISALILIEAGNVDNEVGQTGLAHMFEHMAFKGTDRIGTRDHGAELAVQKEVEAAGLKLTAEVAKGHLADAATIDGLRTELQNLTEQQIALTVPSEFSRLLETYTFDFNASTSPDFTDYNMELPANHLEVWMLMESERFQYPSFREFYREIEIVKEERREQVEDDPAGLARELLLSLAFTTHPYRFPTIGYMSDLEALNHEQAAAFWKTYYVPANALGVLVGDFDPASAKRMLRDYFGDIPAAQPPPPITTREPPQQDLRRATLRKGTERSLLIAFPGFHPKSREASVARLLASALSKDKTSRLDRRLDIEEHAVQRVWASVNWGYLRYPGLFVIGARPLEGFGNEDIERMIWEELDRLQSDPVGEAKLDQIRSAYRKDYYYGLETNSSLAEELAYAQAIHGDWRETYQRFDDYDDITPAEVTRLAAELFQRNKASIVYLEPEAAEGQDHE
jgi:predicted Zn-dependent peptidase